MTSQNNNQPDIRVLLGRLWPFPSFYIRNIVPVFALKRVRVLEGKSVKQRQIPRVNLERERAECSVLDLQQGVSCHLPPAPFVPLCGWKGVWLKLFTAKLIWPIWRWADNWMFVPGTVRSLVLEWPTPLGLPATRAPVAPWPLCVIALVAYQTVSK